jgi:hypothetical protein
MLAAFVGRSDNPLWYFERGWVLVLSGWFVISVLLLPRSGFLLRALYTVGATTVTATLLLLVRRGGFEQIDFALSERLRTGAADVAAAWSGGLGMERMAGQIATAAQRAAELQVMLYPALLGLASIAALAVAWWAYRRLALQEAQPLRPLREFRFPDVLIWVLILGIMLLLLPSEAVATRLGTNLLAFMGALYALRGAGVLLAVFGSPGVLGSIVAGVLLVLLYPLVLVSTAVVGISDTWLDLRARRRRDAEPEA